MKKVLLYLLSVSIATSCSIVSNQPISPLDIKISENKNTFSIKSSTDINEIKKTVFPNKRFYRLNGKPNNEVLKFNLLQNDLKRVFILNLNNGIDGINRISSAVIKVNGHIYTSQNDFNQDISKLSFSIKRTDLKVGENTLEVLLNSKPNSHIDLSIDGFMKPIHIPNAIHSLIPDNEKIRKMPIVKGEVTIKFLEGMKIRLQNNPDGTQKLVDLNGTDLSHLELILKELNLKIISKSLGLSPEQFDSMELSTENYFNKEVPNLNLFYKLKFDENVNVWSIVDKLRKEFVLETSFPSIIPTQPSVLTQSTPNDPFLKEYGNNTIQYNVNKIMDTFDKATNKGIPNTSAWSLLKNISTKIEGGKPLDSDDKNINKIAVIGSGFDLSHEELNDPNDPSRIEYIDNVNHTQITTKDSIDHDTGTSTLAGGTGNNNNGFAGVAYNAKMLLIKASNIFWGEDSVDKKYKNISEIGSTSKGGISNNSIADSILLAHNNKSKVILIEIAGGAHTIEQIYPEVRAVISSVVSKGVNVIVPASNHYDNDISVINTPELGDYSGDADGEFIGMSDTGSIIVGGLDSYGNNLLKASNIKQDDGNFKDIYYNYGTTEFDTNGENSSDNWAHGIDISNTAENIKTASYSEFSGKKYSVYPGTSFGSPMVAGVVSLMLTINPNLTPKEIRQILRRTARGQNGTNYITTEGRKTVGCLDAQRALEQVKMPSGRFPEPNPNTLSVKTSSGQIAQVVKTGSKTSVLEGDKIAVPVTSEQRAKLQRMGLYINPNTFLSYYEIVENFAIYGIDNVPNDLYSLALKNLETGENVVTFQDALLKTAFALGIKPLKPVTFSNGVVVNPDGFISNGSKVQVKAGDNVGISLRGDLARVTIGLGDRSVSLESIVNDYATFKIPPDLPLGVQDVIIKHAGGGTITIKDALEILASGSNFSPSFPKTITTNNINKNINYGFNFNFNESFDYSVEDQSGKSNNGTLSGYHGLLPLRVNNTAIKFQKGSFISVPYNSNYDLGRKFAFLTTLKPHELNREQEILSKWNDGYVNGQFAHSYGMYIGSDNKITLTLADNRQQYFSITHNSNFMFELEKEVGIGVIVDLDADTIKFIKNQTVVDGNIVYSGSPSHYSSLSQLGEVKNSTIPLSIGNYTSRAFEDYSLTTYLNADLGNIASVIEEIKPEEVTKIFYDMGLRD